MFMNIRGGSATPNGQRAKQKGVLPTSVATPHLY